MQQGQKNCVGWIYIVVEFCGDRFDPLNEYSVGSGFYIFRRPDSPAVQE